MGIPFGALVVSLDFELHWGVRDWCPVDGRYRENLAGARHAIPRMLDLFEEFGVAATWATVGFLFARTRAEREEFSPAVRPAYRRASLCPYCEPTGDGEATDPFHYAPSLIDEIRSRPRQEIGTHTFSHYYCLEPGQTAEAFREDLRSAVAMAERNGVRLRSIVFPRNQFNPEYAPLLREAGIVCYRGSQRGWMHRAASADDTSAAMRGARLLDSYASLSGTQTISWSDVPQENGLCDIPASFFLRPWSRRMRYLEPLRFRRIAGSLHRAATSNRIVHLWWHPHNFGIRTAENLAMLRAILEAFARCRETHGLRSLSMAEAARIAMGETGDE